MYVSVCVCVCRENRIQPNLFICSCIINTKKELEKELSLNDCVWVPQLVDDL